LQGEGVPLLRRIGGRTLLDCAVAERVMGDLPLVRVGKRRPE
jgi:hypothetical protein